MGCMTMEGTAVSWGGNHEPRPAVYSWGELRKTGVPRTSFDTLTFGCYRR